MSQNHLEDMPDDEDLLAALAADIDAEEAAAATGCIDTVDELEVMEVRTQPSRDSAPWCVVIPSPFFQDGSEPLPVAAATQLDQVHPGSDEPGPVAPAGEVELDDDDLLAMLAADLDQEADVEGQGAGPTDKTPLGDRPPVSVEDGRLQPSAGGAAAKSALRLAGLDSDSEAEEDGRAAPARAAGVSGFAAAFGSLGGKRCAPNPPWLTVLGPWRLVPLSRGFLCSVRSLFVSRPAGVLRPTPEHEPVQPQQQSKRAGILGGSQATAPSAAGKRSTEGYRCPVSLALPRWAHLAMPSCSSRWNRHLPCLGQVSDIQINRPLVSSLAVKARFESTRYVSLTDLARNPGRFAAAEAPPWGTSEWHLQPPVLLPLRPRRSRHALLIGFHWPSDATPVQSWSWGGDTRLAPGGPAPPICGGS